MLRDTINKEIKLKHTTMKKSLVFSSFSNKLQLIRVFSTIFECKPLEIQRRMNCLKLYILNSLHLKQDFQ